MSEAKGPVWARGGDWVRSAARRVPTKWAGGIGTVLLLAATAAFGGLADAPETASAPDELEAGDRHENDLFAIAVDRAVLIDDLPEAATFPEDGERVLLLVLTVENLWTTPFNSAGELTDGVVPLTDAGEADDDLISSFVRLDDSTVSPILQPGVPAELVMSWSVPASAFAAGDDLVVELRDPSLFTYQVIASGSEWTDYTTTARVTLPIEDVGAGAAS